MIAKQICQYSGSVESFFFAVGEHMHDAAASTVHLGAAETLHVDVLAGDAAHHIGAGDEDAAGRAHDDDVGECRTVGRATGGRPEYHRDLRHLARSARHRREDAAYRVEALDTFAKARAA